MKSFKILAVFVIMICLFLVGCGKKEYLSKYAGTYEGQYTKFIGDADDAIDEEEFKLVLESNGTGTHYRNSLEISVTWSVKDNKINMTEKYMGMTIDYTGTLDGNKLVLYNGDETDPFTAQYVYEKK